MGQRGSSRRSSQAAFRAAVEKAKSRYDLSAIIGRHTKLTKAGPRALRGLCMFHQERSPSLHVYDTDGGFHCFGCGASGDVFDFLKAKNGLGFIDAIRWLDAAALPEVSEAERARQRAEDEAERAAAIDLARTVWRGATQAAGSPAEVYARSRGITVPLPPSIRFARTPAWYDAESGEVGPAIPAVIGCVQDMSGAFIGIQRIFLSQGGRAKAKMPNPKKTLGRFKGGALRLGPVAEGITSCEGPEDGWTLMQAMPAQSIWVALGTANLASMVLPPEVRHLRIGGDNGAAGRAAVATAAEAHTARGVEVSAFFPEDRYKDFNDALRGICA
ncbi:CHC2 zinc finger domain-containing protein [Sphingomonas naphthae]|uniref:CHC2 zinc finger domain-containing protein n=1 Tax=Sphingomonas naphthae TaxID=1813468 RepID=A0ABY7TP60_9SPHN|nr:CHC2 zinc finger domain-containing protein [Sphingomonas naphthae]WCT75019.1 CHC2 zinc finger domain-containing protein [Sphingomonas naphthae]